MMKKLFIPLIICTIIFPLTVYGQDNVNVKELVQKQIAAAKQRMSNKNITKADGVITSNPEVNIADTKIERIDTPLNKIIFLAVSAIIIFYFVGYRRRKTKIKNTNTELKKNIQLIREEKFIKPIDPRLKKIRTTLCLNSQYLNHNEKEITQAAKKYNISTTELLLAAKFRNHSLRTN